MTFWSFANERKKAAHIHAKTKTFWCYLFHFLHTYTLLVFFVAMTGSEALKEALICYHGDPNPEKPNMKP